MHYSYYPLVTGDYRIYQVDSLAYYGTSFEEKPDTLRYKYKDVVGVPFNDAEGNLSYPVERYRIDSTGSRLERVYSIQRTEHDLQVLYDNQRYVKLVFPVYADRTWDADKYNPSDSFDERTSKYKEVHKSYIQSGMNFDSTSVVQLDDFTSFIDKKYWIERYAAGTGLIYSERQELNIQPDPVDIDKKKTSGYIYKLNLIEKGHL
jgi:hypothetical protein